MKLSSLRYLVREGFRSIWQNRFMAIASIGVLISCLLLTGFSYLAFANIDHAFDWVYGQNVVAVFMDEDATDQQIEQACQALAAITNVDSVTFVSKEESLEKLKDENQLTDSTYAYMQENNYLPDSYLIRMKDLSQFDATIMQAQKVDGVDEVSYDGEVASVLTKVRHVVLVVGGWVILMLLVVSLFIIANTIKLTVYNRRLEIYIMKSVGATDGFIRLPFLIEGMVLGIVAALLSFGIAAFVYGKLADMFTFGISFEPLAFGEVWGVLLLGFLLIGILTGVAGSVISMSKYLKREGGGQS